MQVIGWLPITPLDCDDPVVARPVVRRLPERRDDRRADRRDGVRARLLLRGHGAQGQAAAAPRGAPEGRVTRAVRAAEDDRRRLARSAAGRGRRGRPSPRGAAAVGRRSSTCFSPSSRRGSRRRRSSTGASTIVMLRPSRFGRCSITASSSSSSARRSRIILPRSGCVTSRPRNMIVILTLSLCRKGSALDVALLRRVVVLGDLRTELDLADR